MPKGEVTLVSLTKRFDDVVAVDSIDLHVASGEFFSLLGPSGCGKTTTLRMIAGFEEPTEGQILLDGVDVADRPPYKRNVNTVFQSYALFPHLPGLLASQAPWPPPPPHPRSPRRASGGAGSARARLRAC